MSAGRVFRRSRAIWGKRSVSSADSFQRQPGERCCGSLMHREGLAFDLIRSVRVYRRLRSVHPASPGITSAFRCDLTRAGESA